MKRILHIDGNHPLLKEQLEAAGFINEDDFTSTKEEIELKINQYEGVVIRSRFKIDKTFLDKAENLKFIARVGAGLESIDCDYAAEKGITLIAAPEGNRNAVAEHALGMLLSLFNNLNRANSEVKAGKWQREPNRGHELDDKTVGIIGYGNMGKAFAKKLRGFDVKVLCYDILPNVGDSNAQQVSLAELQKQADVLSLHIPWTPDTDKMVNEAFINQFQKPFWLINTARGKSVITADLVNALKTKKILGAGLDVLEFEKLSFESFADNEVPQAFKDLIDFNTLTPSAIQPLAQFNTEVLMASRMVNLPIVAQSRAKVLPELYASYEINDLRKTVYFRDNGNGSYAFKGSYDGTTLYFSGIATDEVYLTRAECNARLGNGDLALKDLNDLLRKRYKTGTYIDLTQRDPALLLQVIIQERRKELLFRGLRWADIKRYNRDGAGISLTRTVAGKTYTLEANSARFAIPIPEDIIVLSGIPQNSY
ncbi:MAG: RagB/SusD family nutrient uptake outer membrane protein [Pedobacter sp.]|nr:MAG: RagB/SusD family nutrient uptake outer membrane protein [Pedobacter sp.]